MKHESLRERVDHALNEPDNFAGRVVEITIGALILAVCMLFALESSPNLVEWRGTFATIEFWITIIFVIEYLVRWWAKGFSVRYLFTPLAVIDLLSILPVFVSGFVAGSGYRLHFVRVLRLFRVFRLLRLVQSRQFFFGEVTYSHLIVLRIVFTVFCLLFVTGGAIYEFEREINPNLNSLFDGVYFAIVTLTTVGYGDITPITFGGRAVTMIMILTGVLVIPWQLTNLARHIVMETNKTQATCETCGLRYHDADASHCKACGHTIYLEYDGR